MTPAEIQKFYAVPVLANVPVVTQFGEGDFSYQGLRGVEGTMDAAAIAASNRKMIPRYMAAGALAGAVVLGGKKNRVMGGVIGAVAGLMASLVLLPDPGPLPTSQPVKP